MLSDLKTITDIIRSAISDFRKFKTDQERQEIILDILRTYFLLKDCTEDAEKLLADAGEDPIAKIKAMDPANIKETIDIWNFILEKQGLRLYKLIGCLVGQNHLAIINPNLQKQLIEIIGDKFDNNVTLHGISAGLLYKKAFSIDYSNEEIAGQVMEVVGAEYDDIVLDLDKINSNLEALKKSLEEYRIIVERLVSDKELLTLSNRARQETLFRNKT